MKTLGHEIYWLPRYLTRLTPHVTYLSYLTHLTVRYEELMNQHRMSQASYLTSLFSQHFLFYIEVPFLGAHGTPPSTSTSSGNTMHRNLQSLPETLLQKSPYYILAVVYVLIRLARMSNATTNTR